MADTQECANMTAQLNIQFTDLAENIDSMFLMFNSVIISLMQAGFACLEAGFINSKNVTSIIMKNVFDMFICGICFWLVGYSLAYSPGNMFLGYSQWAGVGLSDDRISHFFFQFIFAATAATIINGAVAERCNFTAYIVYSSVISGVVYPVVAHWVWAEGGLLALMGFRDFSGSGAVHILAGVCSFVAAAFIGPRLGRFQNGITVNKPGHSTPLVGLGTLLLISGFLSFNGGSLGHISQPGDGQIVARSVTNTILGGSGAAVVVTILCKAGVIGTSTYDFSTSINATLAGMVAMCSGADLFTPLAAVVSGAFATPIYLMVNYFVLFLKVDDPLDAIAVHFGGGLWGIICCPLFMQGGIVYGINENSVEQLWVNLVGAGIIIVWAAVCSVILFGFLKLSGYLRVSEDQEIEGLDISKHNSCAYPLEAWNNGHPQKSYGMSPYQSQVDKDVEWSLIRRGSTK